MDTNDDGLALTCRQPITSVSIAACPPLSPSPSTPSTGSPYPSASTSLKPGLLFFRYPVAHLRVSSSGVHRATRIHGGGGGLGLVRGGNGQLLVLVLVRLSRGMGLAADARRFAAFQRVKRV